MNVFKADILHVCYCEASAYIYPNILTIPFHWRQMVNFNKFSKALEEMQIYNGTQNIDIIYFYHKVMMNELKIFFLFFC